MILHRIVAAALVLLLASSPTITEALEAYALKEGSNPNLSMGPCALAGNTNGTAANYRWYNVCSGYIWIFSTGSRGEAVGVRFGGPEQPEVNDTNIVKRAITYWRNVVQGYSQTVDVFVDIDSDGDGCGDGVLASDIEMDPGLRWNCSDFNEPIPAGITSLIVRGCWCAGGAAPTIATDGPFNDTCDPNAIQRSYYYGIDGSACIPWVGPDGTYDNFLYWLILDGPPAGACCFPDATCEDLAEEACAAAGGAWNPNTPCAPALCPPNAVESKTWGQVKGLFR